GFELPHGQWRSQVICADELSFNKAQDPYGRLFDLQLISIHKQRSIGFNDGRDSQPLRDNDRCAAAGHDGLECKESFAWLFYPGIITKQGVYVHGKVELVCYGCCCVYAAIWTGGIDGRGLIGAELRDEHLCLSASLLIQRT